MKDQARVLDERGLAVAIEASGFGGWNNVNERIGAAVAAYLAAVPSTAVGLREKLEVLQDRILWADMGEKRYPRPGLNRASIEAIGATIGEILAALASEAKPVAGEPPLATFTVTIFQDRTQVHTEATAGDFEPADLLRRAIEALGHEAQELARCPFHSPSPDVAGLDPVAELLNQFHNGRFVTFMDALAWCQKAATALEASASQVAALEGELRDRVDKFRMYLRLAREGKARWKARAETAERELSSERARTAEVVEALKEAHDVLCQTPQAKRSKRHCAIIGRARTVHSTIVSGEK